MMSDSLIHIDRVERVGHYMEQERLLPIEHVPVFANDQVCDKLDILLWDVDLILLD